MKGLIVLHRHYSKLGHALAMELKNRYGVGEFCAYVFSREAQKFVDDQKDIHYTKTLLDQELHNKYKDEILDIEYIKKFEKEYGIPNLWPFLDVDRKMMMSMPPKTYLGTPYEPFYSHEDMLGIFQVKAKPIIKMLKEEKPDFIFFFNIGTMAHVILYAAAKKMGIKTFIIEWTRVGNKITLTEDYKTHTDTEKIFEKINNGKMANDKRKEAEELIINFRKTGSLKLAYLETPATSSHKTAAISPFTSAAFLAGLMIDYLRNPHKEDYTTEDPWSFIKNGIIKKARLFQNRNLKFSAPDWNEDFAFYPLHYEPELSMTLIAQFNKDQIALIRNISRALPAHFKLYVKEHPDMRSRPRKYYDELLKIPNVKLISRKIKSFDAIKNCRLVTTITGTAGWEAALLGKPVITFGDVFFNKLSSVKKCAEMEKLPLLIREQIENFKYSDEEITNFLSAALYDSVEVDLLRIGGQADVQNALFEVKEIRKNEDFQKLASFFAKKLGLAAR